MEDNNQAARQIFQQQLRNNIIAEAPNEDTPEAATHKKEVELPEQKTSEELQQEKAGLQIRETGWWFWRTIIVPPNAYVIHTRRGCKEPVTIGLGKSFRYHPRTDSYLVVPSAMQTIGIVAQGISKEKQGLSILAYVQWLISDFSVAYRRLDFSDTKNPMGIVNAQLREQAEAAIKDKISTMSVQEILTDKAPIIEELTQRMKAVAEGHADGGVGAGGLGVQIITVQIKEAFVSSQKLWEFLQAPFRNQQEREARLSRLHVEEEIKQQELANRKSLESAEAQTQSDIAKLKAAKERESFEVVLKERIRRQELENEEKQRVVELQQQLQIQQRNSKKTLQEQELRASQSIELLTIEQTQETAIERVRLDTEQETQTQEFQSQAKMKQLESENTLHACEHRLKLEQLELQKVLGQKQDEMERQESEFKLRLQTLEHEHTLALAQKDFQQQKAQEEESNRIAHAKQQKELEFLQIRQNIENSLSAENLSKYMIATIPEIARSMPKIQELKTVNISSDPESGSTFSALGSVIAKIMEISHTLGLSLPNTSKTNPTAATQERKPLSNVSKCQNNPPPPPNNPPISDNTVIIP